MADIFSALAVVAVIYFSFEMWGFYYAAKNPPEPYADENIVLEKTATIVRGFDISGNNSIRTGAIELHGTSWNAQILNLEIELSAGDKVKVIGRDGLTLIVEAVPDA